MPKIRETNLPGVGVRHEFETERGDRLGTITHRGGRRDLLIYDREDPDACARVLRLSDEDADALSEMLGGSAVVEQQARVLQDVDGLTIDWLPITHSWSCSGCPVGETSLHQKTGVTIVAVVRDGATLPVPDPSFRLLPGDTAVVVGPARAIEQAQALLQRGG